jgi:hypothetical protein
MKKLLKSRSHNRTYPHTETTEQFNLFTFDAKTKVGQNNKMEGSSRKKEITRSILVIDESS